MSTASASSSHTTEAAEPAAPSAAASLVDELYGADPNLAGRAIEAILEDVDWSRVPPENVKRVIAAIGNTPELAESVAFERDMRDEDLAQGSLVGEMNFRDRGIARDEACIVAESARERLGARRALSVARRAVAALQLAFKHASFTGDEAFTRMTSKVLWDSLDSHLLEPILVAAIVSVPEDSLLRQIEADIGDLEVDLGLGRIATATATDEVSPEPTWPQRKVSVGAGATLVIDLPERSIEAGFVPDAIERVKNAWREALEGSWSRSPAARTTAGGGSSSDEPVHIRRQRDLIITLADHLVEQGGAPWLDDIISGELNFLAWKSEDVRFLMREFARRCPIERLGAMAECAIAGSTALDEMLRTDAAKLKASTQEAA